jgi:hypothetical protein
MDRSNVEEAGVVTEFEPCAGLRLVLVTLARCAPREPVKQFLPAVVRRVAPPFQFEIRELSETEFLEGASSDSSAVRVVPALLLYRADNLIGRVAGLRGKHGTLNEAFVENWLRRHGAQFDQGI